VLLKRIKAKLRTADQWLVKTPEGDPAYRELGRFSRWRRNPNKWVGGYETLETHIVLKELAQCIGVFDPAIELLRR
jgi:hypothetical protein